MYLDTFSLNAKGPWLLYSCCAHMDDTPLNAFIGDTRLNKHYVIYVYIFYVFILFKCYKCVICSS